MSTKSAENIILFDGFCNFCSSSVQFIIKRDPKAYFSFASQQSEIGEKLMKEAGIDAEKTDAMVLIKSDAVYIKSDAALEIAKKLNAPWKWAAIFRFLPRKMRDYAYDLIARNRYKFFGKKENCMIPSKDERKRFLGED